MRKHYRAIIRACLVGGMLLLSLSACSNGPGGDDIPRTGPQVEHNSEERIPRVVPYLDIVPSPVDGQGSAVLKPSDPLPVGARGEFEIAFTVGEAGIATGGFIMFQISPWWGWSRPQTAYPDRPGYTAVDTSPGNAPAKIYALDLNRVIVFRKNAGFEPGEKITFRYRGTVD